MPDRDFKSDIRLASLACAALIVIKPSGDSSIGTAFHVGDGLYVTAKHVLESNKIESIIPYRNSYLYESEMKNNSGRVSMMMHHHDGSTRAFNLQDDSIYVSERYDHPQSHIDISVLKIEGIDVNTPVIELPPFLDDAVAPLDFILEKIFVCGYPPIPFSRDANLVIASGEVNAVIDTRLDHLLRFIVSINPRGGYSGAPVMISKEFCLGVVVESFERGEALREGGFMAAISTDAIRECLDHYELEPEGQRYGDIGKPD